MREIDVVCGFAWIGAKEAEDYMLLRLLRGRGGEDGPESVACFFTADAEDGCCETDADGWV